METKQKDNRCLRDVISTEFNLIKTSETVGGALNHLGALIAKIRRQPHIDCIIASAETEMAEEDRIAFENLEKAVTWFHEKIKILLPYVNWAPDSFAMADVNALLNFHTLSLNANGYVGSLLFQIRYLYSEVAKEEKHRSLFDSWMRTEKKHGYSVEVFDWPDYIDKSLNSLPPDQQLHQWKERADTSLPCLLRFLKILSLYPTFVPLTLTAYPTVDSLPKNLLQLEERQYQAIVGYYLSAFRSPDAAKHPLSVIELIKLVDRFLYMLEQRLEFNTPHDTKSPAQVNIVINQSFFFSVTVKTDAKVTQPASQEKAAKEDVEPVSPSEGKQEHWRTVHLKCDLKVLAPYAESVWRRKLKGCKTREDVELLSQYELAKTLEKEVISTPALLKSLSPSGKKNLLARCKRAIEIIHPREYENHRFAGLKATYFWGEGEFKF